MVQNDIHRPHVLPFIGMVGKIKDASWFCLQSLSVLVKGCGRKLFFACSGNGNGSSWNNRGSNGNYWSASFNSAVNARNLNFNSGGVNPQNNNNRYNGFAVRAVQHTLLSILFLFVMMYETDTATASTRPISGILQCQETQIKSLLCEEMGSQLEAEHGRTMRRFVLWPIQATAIEMLHSRLPEETGDLCSSVQRQNSTSSILQLYSRTLREDIYPGHLQLHQESWNALWNRSHHRLLQKGESQLESNVLRHAPRYSWVLYAYSQKASIGDCCSIAQEDGVASHQQGLSEDMGRGLGYGLRDMADGGYRHAGSKGKLHHSRRGIRLDRFGLCQEYAPLSSRSWSSDRQSDITTILKCISECLRPIHEAKAEVQILWPVCRRCSDSQCGQRMASVTRSRDTEVPARRAWPGPSYGQVGNIRGTSWSGVFGSLHQAIQDVHIKPCTNPYREEDSSFRLLEALEGYPFSQLILRYIQTHSIIQALQEAVGEEGNPSYRSIQGRYDQDNRQKTILQFFKII